MPESRDGPEGEGPEGEVGIPEGREMPEGEVCPEAGGCPEAKGCPKRSEAGGCPEAEGCPEACVVVYVWWYEMVVQIAEQVARVRNGCAVRMTGGKSAGQEDGKGYLGPGVTPDCPRSGLDGNPADGRPSRIRGVPETTREPQKQG